MAGQWFYNPFSKKMDYYDDADTKLAKASNLSDVANAATAFGNIKQAATTSATGVVELATQAEVLAGTDTSRPVVPIDLAARVAMDVNHKAMVQGVNTTYATSSDGIRVADNANINMGTNDFTIVWRGSMPDWAPSTPYRTFVSKWAAAKDEDTEWKIGRAHV